MCTESRDMEAPLGLQTLLRRFKQLQLEYVQCGRIDSVADGIARVYGLDGVQAGELIEFVAQSGEIILGMALNLEKAFVGAVLFGNDAALKEGDLSRRTKSIISVPTGLFLRGRVVDPLGQPLDNKGALTATKQELIERKAPGIQLRARIDSPMATGIRAVDSLVPIVAGCGPDIGFYSQGAGAEIRAYSTLGSSPRRGNGIITPSTGSTLPTGGNEVGIPITRNITNPLQKLPKGAFASNDCYPMGHHCPIRLRKYSTSNSSEAMHLYPDTSTSNNFSERIWRVIGETRKRSVHEVVSGNNASASAENTSLTPKATNPASRRSKGPKREKNSSTFSPAIPCPKLRGGKGEAAINHDLRYENIVSEKALKAAWAQLKSNPGMMTPGASPETLSGISEGWFRRASEALMAGNFEYPKKRRVQIPKPSTTETRPLTISNPRVKIIERAILNAIEPLFEGTWKWKPISEVAYDEHLKDLQKSNNEVKKNRDGFFGKQWEYPTVWHSNSFGFRPNRSAHDALKSIKYWRKNTVWILDYDVRKAFDNVNRRRLANIFDSHLKMPRLWQEIEKMLNVGIIDLKTVFEKKGVGQGSILSPFLFNMYMHEFDKSMLNWKNKHTQETALVNPEATKEYKNLMAKFGNARIHTALKEFKTVEALDEARRAAKKHYYDKWGRAQGGRTGQIIQYVRYADDFIIGIVGPKRLATDTRRHIDQFFKSNLHLDVKRNDIVNRNQGGVQFLGFQVYLPSYKKKTRIKWNKFASIEKYKSRVLSRLRVSDARLANAAAHSMKKELLKTLNENLSEEGLKYSQANLAKVAHKTLLSQKQENPAIQRWVEHFSTEKDKELSLATKYYDKNIRELQIPEADNDVQVKIASLRKQFLDGIKELVEKEKIQYREKRIKTVTSRREEALKRSRLTNKPTLWSDVSEETAIRVASSLSDDFLDQRQPRMISISAPIKNLAQRLASKGFYHPSRLKPTSNIRLLILTDAEIMNCYSSIMYGIINYYKPADNLSDVKGIVEGLRKSCVLTLARKHKKNTYWVYAQYGDDIRVTTISGKEVTLPTTEQIGKQTTGFQLGKPIGFDLDKLMFMYHRRDHLAGKMFSRCAVLNCTGTHVEIHHVKKLARKVTSDKGVTILNKDGRRISGRTAMLSAIGRKQIPLCPEHHLLFEKGTYSTLDADYLKTLYNRSTPDTEKLKKAFLHGAY